MLDIAIAKYAELLSLKNGMQTMRPFIEKELFHYEIVSALDKEYLLSSLVFQGGTCLTVLSQAFREVLVETIRGL